MTPTTAGTTNRFTDHVAVITGAASGIGAATAKRLAEEGAAVVLADIAAERGAALAKDLQHRGSRAEFVRADASDPDDWERVAAAAHAFGPVSVLVSNAYAVEDRPLHETNLDSWNHQFAVNVTATYLGFRTFLADLRERRGAAVLTSSVQARVGIPGHGAYAATKGALLSLCGQLAVEYGPKVRVNAVLPGPILTGAWEGMPDADRVRTEAATAAGRLGEPEEVAAAIAFLAAPEASYITGASLAVDGGWLVQKDSA